MLSYAPRGEIRIGFFVPFVLLTFLMGLFVQEMTVRLGPSRTGGTRSFIFDRFGTFWGRFAMAEPRAGNFLTLVTEFIGIRAGSDSSAFPVVQ